MIACIGKFDALHRGHRALVAAAAALGSPVLCPLAGMAEVLGWPPRAPLLAEADRARVLALWGRELDCTVSELPIPFAQVRQLHLQDFCVFLRERGARGVVVGEDFRGGKDRAQDAHALRRITAELGLSCAVVPALGDHVGVISSSRVRAAVVAGDMGLTSALCARPYRLLGTVQRGDGRGRTLGFPTANLGGIAVLLPANGVYAASVELDGARVAAALNIGHAPSIAADRARSVEAHLLDWTGDLYGKTLAVDLCQRLRGEQRFASRGELIAAISADVAAVRALRVGAAPP